MTTLPVAPDGGILNSVWIQNPNLGQTVTYNGQRWINSIGSGSVVTDGQTIQGDGSPTGSAIALKQVFTDASLVGNGVPTNTLGLALQNSAGSYTNFAATFNKYGIATLITAGAGTVATDGVSILGDGSNGNPLNSPMSYDFTTKATVTTTNAAATNLITLTIPTNTAWGMKYEVVAKTSPTPSSTGLFENIVLFANNGGSVTSASGNQTKLAGSTWSISTSVSAQTITIVAIGAASTTIIWKATVRIWSV